ncbi:hypothetical protein Ssi03_62380 [Sphaerisporangium siamense]|nr:hypothetical protein Ssi03_62380 [Sphaerisporangium siamense]
MRVGDVKSDRGRNDRFRFVRAGFDMSHGVGMIGSGKAGLGSEGRRGVPLSGPVREVGSGWVG